VALLFGLGVDLLFDGIALGINVPIVVLALLVAATLLRPPDASIDRLDLWLPPVAIVAALGIAVRTDPPVVGLDLALATLATVAWTVALAAGPVTRSSVTAVASLGGWAAGHVVLGATLLIGRAIPTESAGLAMARARRALPVTRGVLVAIPIVLIFTLLLSSADAVFRQLLSNVLAWQIDLRDGAQRAAVIFGAAWLIGGGLSIAASGMPLAPRRRCVARRSQGRHDLRHARRDGGDGRADSRRCFVRDFRRLAGRLPVWRHRDGLLFWDHL
ncbi:MAG: DUF4153 domain-containing protein, partial [Candidatus Limnocylindrales bacterium]